MSLRRSIRHRLLRVAGAAAVMWAFLAGPAVMAADTLTRPIEDPHYGDILFYFYQDHYFTALTGLMASQHFNRIPQHADEAELLRGGIILSYGLHREAGDIFAQLIEKGASPAVRDRAWFYLAKIRYQRGFIPEAEDAVARIENHLPPELEEERNLLKANLLMARGDFAGAAAVLIGIDSRKGARQYVRFNLGVALIKSGDAVRGTNVLDALGRTPAANEEFRSLRDRANVALGFTALQESRFDAARTYLERVRLESMHANKALLAFGWAAAGLKKPNLALVPWTELVSREGSDSAVLEARIAIAYAYAELGAYGQALDRYNEAIAAFEREKKNLDESIAAIRSGKLVDGLLERNPGDEMGWFWNITELPDMPHAGHLAQVLAQHEFQEAFKNYRDLRFLTNNLLVWQDKLDVYTDMLANRRAAYEQRLPKIRSDLAASENGLQAQQQRRDHLAQALARAENAADGVAFADARQRELQTRLTDVQAALSQAASDPEFSKARQTVRLAAGSLTWQLAQQLPARRWDAQKGLGRIDTELAEAQQHDAALERAQRDEPARFDRFSERIAGLDPQIKVLLPRVAALSSEQQRAVQDLAIAELVRQQERLAIYMTQARFAVAQLYDRANAPNAPKEADHAGQ